MSSTTSSPVSPSSFSSISNRLAHSSSVKQNDHTAFLDSLPSSDFAQSSESLGLGFGVGMTAGLAITLTLARPLLQLITSFLSPASASSLSSSTAIHSFNGSAIHSNWTTFAVKGLSSTYPAPPLPLPSSSFSSFFLVPLSSLPSLTATHIFYLTVFLSLCYLYRILTRPLVFQRPLTPQARAAALRKSYADMPPPYPNAWFKLCDVMDVEGDKVCRMRALGRDMVVRRGENGELFCQDETGGLWEVCEANQVIFVWHDEMHRSSAWQVPVVSQDINTWKFGGRTAHEIICHIQEIPENGADTAHLDFLHGDFVLDFISAAKHTWQASWTPQPFPNQHIAKIAIDTQVALFGHKISLTQVKTRISQVGPGIVQLQFPTPFGNVLLQETITPIESNIQRACHVLWFEPTVPRLVAKTIMKSTLMQFERDFGVWFYKRWIRAPLAVKEDGPILKYRRWVKQFFDRQGGQLVRDFDGNEQMIERTEREH